MATAPGCQLPAAPQAGNCVSQSILNRVL